MIDKKEKDWYGGKKFLKGIDEQKYKAHMEKVDKEKVSFNSFSNELNFVAGEIDSIIQICQRLLQDKTMDPNLVDHYISVLTFTITNHLNLFINKFNKDIVMMNDTETKEFYDSFSKIFTWAWNRQKHSRGNIHEVVDSAEHTKRCAKEFEQTYKKPMSLEQWFNLLENWQHIKDKNFYEMQKETIGEYSFATGSKPIAKTLNEFLKQWETLPIYPNYLVLLDEIELYRVNTTIVDELKQTTREILVNDDGLRMVTSGAFIRFYGKTQEIIEKLYNLKDLWNKEDR